MHLRFLLDLDHVDSTEEADVNPVERCLGRPYNTQRLQQREKSVRSTSLFSGVRLFVHSTSVFCKLVGFVASSMIILVFNFYRFDVSRFKFDVVTFKGVKIQEEQIQKWREDIMLVPYLRSIK